MQIQRTVYSFGSPCDKEYGKLVLMRDGTIYGYTHPNEHTWFLSGKQLIFRGQNGRITSRFKYCDQHKIFFGKVEGKKWPLYLIPIIHLGHRPPQDPKGEAFPSVFVNSIPKAGTYFMEAVLKDIGLSPTRIHVSGRDIIDDYRGLEDSLMHKNPQAVRLFCPIELITVLLDGEVMVGHVEHTPVIRRIREQGICVFQLVRNLRSVLLSLYRFKLHRVSPNDSEPPWRSLPPEKSVKAFIMYYHDKDLNHIRAIAKSIIRDEDAILMHYEKLCHGVIPEDAYSKIQNISPALAARLPNALKRQLYTNTPTFMGRPTR